MMKTCATCSHSHKAGDSPRECRAHPKQATIVVMPVQTLRGPQLTPQCLAGFPGVADTDWCGEWRPRIELAQ